MLSGIGPATDLAPLMIPVGVDLPVGEGLQDHPSVGMSWHSDTRSHLGERDGHVALAVGGLHTHEHALLALALGACEP
jgi:hypothetical protein